MISLPALGFMYMYSHPGNQYSEHLARQANNVDWGLQRKLYEFMTKDGEKVIRKYMDLTPRYTGNGVASFPLSFPYRFNGGAPISAYAGMNFYLAPRADYMENMAYSSDMVFRPNWEWLWETGVDFFVLPSTSVDRVRGIIEKSRVGVGEVVSAADGVSIVSVRSSYRDGTLFDNGFFRVSKPRVVTPNSVNLAFGRPAQQSSTYGSSVAKLAVDGNSDGDFANGSVSHTLSTPNPWLTIDLESIFSVGEVKVFNRTDCCQDRLSQYWVVASEHPVSVEDPFVPFLGSGSLQRRWVESTTLSSTVDFAGFPARFIHIQRDTSADGSEGILSVAEVQVFLAQGERFLRGSATTVKGVRFESNYANWARLELEVDGPAELTYLFWNRPGLSIAVNGTAAGGVGDGGLFRVSLPEAGRYVIELRYRNSLMLLFWLFLLVYSVLMIWVIFNSLFCGSGGKPPLSRPDEARTQRREGSRD